MPRIALSDLSIKSAKMPPKSAITLWDAVQPKLGLRITPAGAKSFVYMVGSGRRKVLGRYPELSLKDARAHLTRLLAEKTLGHVPIAAATEAITVSAAIALYIEKHCDQISKNGSQYSYETKRLLTNHLAPKFKDRAIDKISKSDIAGIIDGLADRPSEASHAFTAVRSFFAWSVSRGHADKSPCDGLQGPPTPPSRERVLTADELTAVWQKAVQSGFPYGTFLQLLILLAQRRGEISKLQRDWIDKTEKTITFPGTVTKNGRTHIVPYEEMTAAILDAVPDNGCHLFPASRERRKGPSATTMSGWGKKKAAFDKTCPIAPWTLHDLRRTASTLWAEIGVPEHINDRLLNHVTGGKQSPVAAICNRYQYLAEKRAAMHLWEKRLAEILA